MPPPRDADDTPARKQYLEIKARYPGVILFFRMGDFYETFDADAELVARELEIALTSRPQGRNGRIPLAGFPYHAVDGYLAKLIGKGYRVAICDQLEDAKLAKGVVQRGVVRVVTPGTLVEPQLLDSRRNNYLAAYAPGPDRCGIAYIDITTSEFAVTQLPPDRALAELERLGAAEVLVPKSDETPPDLSSGLVTPVEPDWFHQRDGRERVMRHFGVSTLEAFGCDRLPLATAAAGAILAYLAVTQPPALAQVTRMSTYSTEQWIELDMQTRRNLELFQRSREATAQGSLLSVLDQTKTPMGARLLRRRMERPLKELAPLEQRLDGVQAFFEGHLLRAEARKLLGSVPDLERLVNRVRGGIALPRDLLALRVGLSAIPTLKEAMARHGVAERCAWLSDGLHASPETCDLIAAAIADDPPAAFDQGGVIRKGYSTELDDLRERAGTAKEAILGLERRERERTGIRSLKVGFNRVFGYYIEVSNTHRELVPDDYHRKQTLVGAERFFTPELKDWETSILNGQEQALDLERELFRQVCGQIVAGSEALLSSAAALAVIDVAAGLAEVAVANRYVRPSLATSTELRITAGRHPVVELALGDGSFVPNDTTLDTAECQIALITGPNMAGKSTYLRQVALITLMAQVGSFVPASSATVGLVDRIFTRIGAQDDLATGQSTFMVEMVETASILHHATPRSLVILDEIGRGTSTYDGISIAQAVVEYLHNQPAVAAKTLFATHYHELTSLAGYLPRVHNFTFSVTEDQGQVVFLRRILPGAADRSYGIHVARLAGLPEAVSKRAEEVLHTLESQATAAPEGGRPRRKPPASAQLALLPSDDGLSAELLALEPDTMTPLEALNRLYQLKQRAERLAQR